MSSSAFRPADYIDNERGLISREIFVNPELHRQELDKLFTRAWLFVGHESQVPLAGDFFQSRMGDESVILCRDKAMQLHVFLNSCRHRGMKVCRYDSGNTSLFTCPYHSWAYGLDGKLLGVPQFRELYQHTLDKDANSLITVGRMHNYKGAVFATWDPGAPDFETWLGGAKEHLDLVLDCRDGRPGGSEVIGVHKWIFPSNWKFAAENFLGDTYHNISHRSVDLIGIGPSARAGVTGRRDNEMDKAKHIWAGFPAGHGVHSAILPEDNEYIPSFMNDPEVEEYFRHCFYERKRRMGEKSRLIPFTGNLFPNISFHGRQPRNLCNWHPHSPTETEGWRFFLVDADAPAVVKDFLRRYYMRYSGPAGMTEQDDMENWLYATAASRGAIARRHPFNYQQSLGKWDVTAEGGHNSWQVSEQNPRNYYRVWAEFLNGSPWDVLVGGDPSYRQQAAQ